MATILCPVPEAGRPRTRRILPEHLIPRSPLFSQGLQRLLEEGRDKDPGFLDAACQTLGCIDPRTARKHTLYLRAAVEAKLPVVAELLASAPEESEGPTFPPATNPFVILCLLWDQFIKSAQGLSGSFLALSLRSLLWLAPGLEAWRRFHRSCIPSCDPP